MHSTYFRLFKISKRKSRINWLPNVFLRPAKAERSYPVPFPYFNSGIDAFLSSVFPFFIFIQKIPFCSGILFILCRSFNKVAFKRKGRHNGL
ncbi:hypothetical protein DRI50_03570 [candidate division KSB1 bacterium]|nr:MAG: hypothetical protein DRI50_03570 [candidate division KSB1 bacterium]